MWLAGDTRRWPARFGRCLARLGPAAPQQLDCLTSDPMRAVGDLRVQDKASVEVAIKEAEDKCASGTTGECAAAWDNVSDTQQRWSAQCRRAR